MIEIDELKKIIQNFFQSNTVTIVGSGLSIAEGIPGMAGLAEQLKEKMVGCLDSVEDRNCWNEVMDQFHGGCDLETALQIVSVSAQIEEKIRCITARFIWQAEQEVLRDVIENNRKLRFSSYISRFNLNNYDMHIITTNYDRLIEYACELQQIRIDTFLWEVTLRITNQNRASTIFVKGFVAECIDQSLPQELLY